MRTWRLFHAMTRSGAFQTSRSRITYPSDWRRQLELIVSARLTPTEMSWSIFRRHRTLAAGDVFVSDPKTPQLIDYAGGGSAKEWTRTLELSLQLDFDTVVPGHGKVATKEEMRKFREDTIVLGRNRMPQDDKVQKKTRDEIARMLQNEFHWEGVAGQVLMAQSFDGLIGNMGSSRRNRLRDCGCDCRCRQAAFGASRPR